MTAASPRSWPFVGRTTAQASLARDLADPDVAAVVVTAPAGAGKTALARAATSDAALPPMWWRASPPTAHVPFGTLTDVLDLDGDPEPTAAFRRLADRVRDAGGLVVVDDAPHLDPRSADLLHRLVETGKAKVLATARAGVAIPAWLEWLWLGEATRHHAVDPLTTPEVRTLVDLVLPDLDEVEAGAYATSLSARTAGNALLLRELLADAARRSADGRPPALDAVPEPLLRVLQARLDAADPLVRRPVEAVALLGALPLAVAAEAFGTPALDAAERGGWLVVGDADRRPVRLAHPLHGEVALASCTGAARRRLAEEVAPVVLRSPGASPTERLAATAVLVDHGVPAPHDALLEGARTAFAALDHELAARLAAAALEEGDDVEARIVLGAAHSGAGRPDDAEAALRGAVAIARSDQERARAAGRLSVHLIAHGARIGEAAALLDDLAPQITDPTALAFLEADRAKVASLRGDLSTAAAPLPDGADEIAVLNASIVGAYAQAMAADPAAARATVAAALPLAEEHRATLPWSGELVRFSLPFAALAGDGPTAACAEATEGLHAAATASEATVGTWRYLTGFAHAVAGTLGAAAAALDRAVDELDGHDLINARPLARAARSWVAGQVGDVDGARREIDRCLDDAAVDARVRSQVVIAEAWCDVAERGAIPDATVAKLRDALREAAAGGQLLSALLQLHDLVRLGAAEVAADELGRLGALPDVWLVEVVRTRAGLRADDDAGRARLARRLAGRWPLAEAELAAERARLAQRRGDAAAAARAALAAEVQAERLGPLRPWTLASLASPLTSRELEVARAVATGSSNRAVAELAGVSVRTVENQLQSVYRKLHLAGRAELVRLLAPTAATTPT